MLLSSIAISLPKLQLYIGCSGWSYSAWSGHFYPAKLDSKNYLEYYSKVFDYVEIDSSFYRTPSTLMTSRWAKVTSHKKRLGQGIDDDMHCFTRILSLHMMSLEAHTDRETLIGHVSFSEYSCNNCAPKAPNKPPVRDNDMLYIGYTAISKSYPSQRK